MAVCEPFENLRAHSFVAYVLVDIRLCNGNEELFSHFSADADAMMCCVLLLRNRSTEIRFSIQLPGTQIFLPSVFIFFSSLSQLR